MITFLQYVRALCALAVTWHHAREQLPGLQQMFPHSPGAAGTTVLMIISGFVAMASTAKSPMPAKQFLVRRFMRITPLYWLATLAVAAITLSSPESFKSTVVTFDTLIQSLLFIPHPSLGHPGYVWPILYPGWTLHYIAFFYLIFAACMAISYERRGTLALLVLLVLILIGQLAHFEQAVPYIYTNRLLLTFIVGMALGEWHLRRLKTQPRKKEAPSRNAALRFLALMGSASFSIYLTHMFALVGLRLVWRHFDPTPVNDIDGLAFMATGMVLSVALGWLVWTRVELPLVAWSQKKLTALGWLRVSEKKADPAAPSQTQAS